MGKSRLLIVEDDTDISNMLRIYFTGQSYDVDTALRGSEALEKTRQNLPHLIVLDIMLPDIDGFEVCRILRTHTRTSHVPIIFLTRQKIAFVVVKSFLNPAVVRGKADAIHPMVFSLPKTILTQSTPRS